MVSPKFSEDVHSITELKTRASALVKQVRRSRRPLLLTRRGRGVAVLLDLEEYERLVDRAAFIEAVDKGAKAAAAADLYPHAAAEKIRESFGETNGE